MSHGVKLTTLTAILLLAIFMQNQGCAACDIDDLYTWFGGDVDAVLENGTFVITQTELLQKVNTSLKCTTDTAMVGAIIQLRA